MNEEFKYVKLEIRERAAWIILNRPEVHNALSAALLNELGVAVANAASNKEIRVIVLTAEGEQAFSSGADLKDGFNETEKTLGDRLRANYEPVIEGIRSCPKPVICRMNGLAAGAGMSLALACDLVIAADHAYMTELFVGIGLMPDAGSMFFLPRLVGMQKAFELISTGRKVQMPEAEKLGLVNKIVPFNELDDAVGQLVSYYAQAPTMAIGLMKKALNVSYESSLREMLDLEAEGQTACGFSNDFGEGVMAFLQKRKPDFKGR